MPKNKSSISKASSYHEIGEFWDSHDLSDLWDKTRPVEFEINIETEETYYAVDAVLSKRIHSIAKKRGVSPETLLNLWIQEKIQKQKV